jgi:hypothetical protein
LEDFGLILFTLGSLGVSSVLALVALLFRRLRRFSLAIFSTPPAAAILFFLSRWTVIDNSHVCGPNIEWDRCPSIQANMLGWLVWVLGIITVAVAANWAQRVIQAAITLLFDTKPSTTGNSPNHSTGGIDGPKVP